MTKYRTIHDGYREWLQYFATIEIGWWIFKRQSQKWEYIRSDYYDYFDEKWENWESRYGFSNGTRNSRRYINSEYWNLKEFITHYQNIEDWFTHRNKHVQKQREIAHDYHKQIELKKGSIKNINS